MSDARVFLIGGAPGVGKTTLCCALAARIGGSSVTVDDLMTVAKTATTPETHPGLYLYRDMSYLDYFTNSSMERFQSDAERQHEAVWPFVKNLIEKHFHWTTTPIVIDGWHLRPHRIAELDRDKVDANLIFISRAALEKRERKNVDFVEGSSNPEKMFQNFLNRSLWFNDLIKREADEFGMRVVYQDGATAVDEMVDVVLSEGGRG